MGEFTGYSDDAFAMLRELPSYDKDRFASDKKRWNGTVLDPTKALVTDLIEPLRDRISPTIDGAPKVNGSISPINNDLRFSPDKSPYKDHLLIAFWDGPSKKTSPVLHLRIASDAIGFATGSTFQPDLLDRWRELVDADDTGALLAGAIDEFRDRGADVAGEDLKRVPRPYDADHPRGDLLRHKWLQVRWSEPLPDVAGSSALIDHLADRLATTATIHCWLRDHLHG